MIGLDQRRLFGWPQAGWVIAGLALWALGLALLSQYGFGHEPCALCHWQRVPYGAVLLLLPVLFWAWRWQPLRGALLLLVAAIFLAGAGIAFYHTGVEQLWWGGLAGCSVSLNTAATDDLLAAPVASCDQISWQWLGLSMAAWNVLYSLACTLYALLAANESQAPAAACPTLGENSPPAR